jgi:hypothetical protein
MDSCALVQEATVDTPSRGLGKIIRALPAQVR